jgi:hypothetical protein
MNLGGCTFLKLKKERKKKKLFFAQTGIPPPVSTLALQLSHE